MFPATSPDVLNLSHKGAGLIMTPREEHNGVSCGPIIKHCFCDGRANELYRPRVAGCTQAHRVSRGILGREMQVALDTASTTLDPQGIHWDLITAASGY